PALDARHPSGRRRAGTYRAGRRGAALEEDDVSPDAVQIAEPLAHADLAEAACLVQPDRRLVLGEHAGAQRPVAVLLGTSDELFEQRPTKARAACILGHVDAHLTDS